MFRPGLGKGLKLNICDLGGKPHPGPFLLHLGVFKMLLDLLHLFQVEGQDPLPGKLEEFLVRKSGKVDLLHLYLSLSNHPWHRIEGIVLGGPALFKPIP